METQLKIQSTPNPNALKFVLNRPVKTEGKVSYKNPEECHTNPLARLLFSVPNVVDLHFFENSITVTQDGSGDWDGMVEQIKTVILQNIDQHDPNFIIGEAKKKLVQLSPDLVKIDEILEKTVRPYLQADGGDLQLVNLNGNTLTVIYQGACGSCPSSTAGTLKAIEGILKEQYNPEIIIQAA